MSEGPPDTRQALAKLLAESEMRFAKYHSALGEFISEFSSVEWNINNLIRHYCKISRIKSNVLLGPLRMDNALNMLNKLKNATLILLEDIPEIGEIVEQLRKINRLRNDIVHYGISGYKEDEGFIITNKFYSYKNKEVISHIVSPEALEKAALDLTMIHARIGLLIYPDMRERRPYGHLLHEPWRYIPQLQPPPNPKRQASSLRRRTRRRASPS